MTTDIDSWNKQIIAEFRANAGYVSWSTDEDLALGRPVPPRLPAYDKHQSAPIILLHHTGSKTGLERINPIMYLPHGDDFAIFATYGGSPRDPQWYRNLTFSPQASVEVGTERVPTVARIAHGAEREGIWAKQVTLMPAFAGFEATAGRKIPVVVLERIRNSY